MSQGDDKASDDAVKFGIFWDRYGHHALRPSQEMLQYLMDCYEDEESPALASAEPATTNDKIENIACDMGASQIKEEIVSNGKDTSASEIDTKHQQDAEAHVPTAAQKQPIQETQKHVRKIEKGINKSSVSRRVMDVSNTSRQESTAVTSDAVVNPWLRERQKQKHRHKLKKHLD